MYPTPPGSVKRKRTKSVDLSTAKRRKLFIKKLSKGIDKKKWLKRSRRMLRKQRPYRRRIVNGKGKSLSGLRLRKKKVSAFEKQGVSVKFEYNGTYSTQESGTPTYDPTQFAMIGHTSSPPKQILACLAYAIIKKMAIKLNFPIGNFEVTVWDGGYPVWITLCYGDKEFRFNHSELSDIEYAVKEAKKEALNCIHKDFKGEI